MTETKTPPEALVAYSEGRLDRNDAIEQLGLRDYAALLVALGDYNLPMPMIPQAEIDEQAETFEQIWAM